MIKILPWTYKDPLNMIGACAGYCWGSNVVNPEENIKRAKFCIKSNHGRAEEFPDIYCTIDGYSARCIRELSRHCVGTTFLQSSTRYVDAKDMNPREDFFYPYGFDKTQTDVLFKGYKKIMETYNELESLDVNKEDAANILPLGMNTDIVWKLNVRALIHFMELRLCNRAYKEIRQLCIELKNKMSEYSDEWKWIADNYFVPSCKTRGYCIEAKCCGAAPKGIEGLKKQAITGFLIYQSKIDNMGQPTVLSNKTIELIDEFLKNSNRS